MKGTAKKGNRRGIAEKSGDSWTTDGLSLGIGSIWCGITGLDNGVGRKPGKWLKIVLQYAEFFKLALTGHKGWIRMIIQS